MARRPRAAIRRTNASMARLAEEARAARGSLGLSRAAVAAAAGVARSTVERVENGVSRIEVGTLAAVLAAVGLDLSLRAFPTESFGPRDRLHAAQIDQLRTAAALWRARVEVRAGEHGRAADLVLYGADEVIHIEVERRLADLQAQLRSAHLKRDSLVLTTDRPVRLVVAVTDTLGNRAAAAPFQGLVASQLPADSRAVMRSLRSGKPLGMDGFLWVRGRNLTRRETSHPGLGAVTSGKTSHEGGSGRGLAG